MKRRSGTGGFTLLEVLISIVLGALIVAGVSSVISQLSDSRTATHEHGELIQDASFAMNRMVQAARQSRGLMLPQPDKDATNWSENIREETVPASPPEGSSTLATAVLAVSLGAQVDLDADGFPDADNDRDGRIDEDYPDDITFDFAPGIYQIDDGGDGQIDEGNDDDEDEDGTTDEDPINGVDDDGDGQIDEDPAADMNGDGAPAIFGIDDDDDGQIDEGSSADDDEDGSSDEDWLDAVVFYLQSDALIERHPVPWDETSSNGLNGRDFVESPIAEGVSRFRVERVAGSGSTAIVDITLELTDVSSGETVSLHTRVRVGGAQ